MVTFSKDTHPEKRSLPYMTSLPKPTKVFRFGQFIKAVPPTVRYEAGMVTDWISGLPLNVRSSSSSTV